MHIRYHKQFKKAFAKQPKPIQEKFFIVLDVFIQDQFDQQLRNHALSGEFRGVRSIDITGDVRVHYENAEGMIVLLMIGTHAQLYK